jgi:hypothetical protein
MGQTTEDVRWATLRGPQHWSARQAQWVMAELTRSGLSTRCFAAQHKVGLKRIYYWRARLQSQGSSKQVTTGLVEVRVPLASAQSASPSVLAPTRIEIELLSGRRLGVSESIDLARLGALVALLEQR